MTVTLANIPSAENAIQTLNNFEKCSGMKRNLSKSKAMWIGANKNLTEKPLGLDWCTGVKTLGIYFSCNREEVIKQDFHRTLGNVQKND